MKNRLSPVRTTVSLAVVVVLVLVSWEGSARTTGTVERDLIGAAMRGDLALINNLLEHGVDVNAKDQYGRSALTTGAEKSRGGVVRLLLEKGADVNTKDYRGWSALMHAATRGDIEMMRLLLDKGAVVNAKSDTGWTAPIGAAGNGHLEAVKLLLARGAEVDVGKNDLTALHAAAGRGHLQVVKLLLDKGAAVNARTKDGFTALMLAAGNGHLQVLEFLLKNGADVDAKARDGSTALMMAAAEYYGQKEPGPSLIDAIVDILRGAWAGRFDRLGPYYPRRTQNQDPEVLKCLLRKGADVNARAGEGSTALTRAQKAGTPEIVEVLKAHGAKD